MQVTEQGDAYSRKRNKLIEQTKLIKAGLITRLKTRATNERRLKLMVMACALVVTAIKRTGIKKFDIYLVGSVAYGIPHKGSDLDLLIDTSHTSTEAKDLAQMIQKLAGDFQTHVLFMDSSHLDDGTIYMRERGIRIYSGRRG